MDADTADDSNDKILKTVHSIFGKPVTIVDCGRTASLSQEEVLQINGVSVQLNDLAGDDAAALKSSLLTGQMPSVKLLNQLLVRSGLLQHTVQLETSLLVKSTIVTKEEVLVMREGCLLDERSTETKDNYYYQFNQNEILQPLRVRENKVAATDDATTTATAVHTNLVLQKHPEGKLREAAVRATTTKKAAAPALETTGKLCCNVLPMRNADLLVVRKLREEEGIESNYSMHAATTAASNIFRESNCCFPTTTTRKTLSSNVDSQIWRYPRQMLALNTAPSIEIYRYYNNEASAVAATVYVESNIIPPGETPICRDKTDDSTLIHNSTSNLPESPSPSVSSGNGRNNNNSSSSADWCNNLSPTSITTLSNNLYKTSLRESSIKITSTTLTTSNDTQQRIKQHKQQEKKPIAYKYIKPQTSMPIIKENYTMSSPSSKQTHASTPLHMTQQQKNNFLVYSEADGTLLSATLEALIDHVVPTAVYYPDSNYVFSFLLSARLFIRPHDLLKRIATKWEEQQHEQQENYTSEETPNVISFQSRNKSSPAFAAALFEHQNKEKRLSANNCIRLLGEWFENFPYDFRDEHLMQEVRLLTRKCVYIDSTLGKQVSAILQLLMHRLTVLKKHEDVLQSLDLLDTVATKTINLQQEEIAATEVEVNKTNIPTISLTARPTNCYNVGAIVGIQQPQTTTVQPYSTIPSASYHLTSSMTTTTRTTKTTMATTKGIELQSSLCIGTAVSSRTYPAKAAHNWHQLLPLRQQQLQQLQHNTQKQQELSDSSTNSLNFPLHQLSTHFSNSNSKSFYDIHDVMHFCASAAQLAQQLTAIELEHLAHIGPEEFVQSFTKEYRCNQNQLTTTSDACVGSYHEAAAVSIVVNHATSANDIKKTRNLESYVEWFNHLSYFTATEVVKYRKKKQRVRIIEYWIETALECFNIGNFNSLVAIIAGLNLAPIVRLRKTWSKVQTAKLSVLEHQMDPTSNFNSYRSTLKAAIWRSAGATEARERIIIPFFSLFLKDLYFINEGCSNRLPNNHINFEKCSQLARQVIEFNEWKKATCPFEKLPFVIMLLQNSAVLNENTLTLASFQCEHPENTQEKYRYKTLKSEKRNRVLQQEKLFEQQKQQ